MKRRTPLRRSGALKRSRRHPFVGDRPPEETRTLYRNDEYRRRKAIYFAAHPFCQLTIARLGIDEAELLAHVGLPVSFVGQTFFKGSAIPRATEIHHRNKRSCEARLLDERWWMAVSRGAHETIEAAKDWARAEGYLLPINALPDGSTPPGTPQPIPTPELMASKVRT